VNAVNFHKGLARLFKASCVCVVTLSAVLSLFVSVTFGGGAGRAETAAFAKEERTVYLGGTPMGVVAKSAGVVIYEITCVITKDGSKTPAKDAGLLKGDLITAINGKLVFTPADVAAIVSKTQDKELTISVRRSDKNAQFKLQPLKDSLSNDYKIGILVKNELTGIGTLTYVTTDSLEFGGLGHKITDGVTSCNNAYVAGNILEAKISGLIKGEVGQAGELKGNFVNSDTPIGTLHANNIAGVFGKASEKLYKGRPMVAVGSRKSVNTGKAYIYSSLSSDAPEKYEIEIMRLAEQDEIADRSMVIKVTDERLKDLSGGIVQGMSGSPIVQNGRLIGAVTHVFISDPTRGYGIYIDWMLANNK
jgi:stage IV sporulation protein B